MKACNLCKELKPEDEFYKSLGRIRLQCKFCLKMKQTAAKFGLTYERLLAMYEEQDYRCKICRQKCDRYEGLCVDHDHTCCPMGHQSTSCGKCVRGLLCARCNHGLGNFRDNPEYLRAAADYLGL